MDDLTLGEMLTEAFRGQVDYFVKEACQSVSCRRLLYSMDQGNLMEKWCDGSGQPDERNSSEAQIRTLLEEQRFTILPECHARVSRHELQAAQAEEERRLLQGQLWQQKLEFREARQHSLTEMEELRKFRSPTFDTIARRKLIEDQNTSQLYERFLRIFRMLNQFAVEIPTLPVDQCHSHLIQYLKGC